MGDFFSQLPLVIVAALTMSLFEAIVILPAHLKHLPSRDRQRAQEARFNMTLIGRVRKRSAVILDWFSHSTVVRLYESFLALALRWRYVTVASGVAALMAAVGLVVGGVVRWEFIQKMDSETIIADLKMPIGTPASQTRERLVTLSAAARKLPEVRNVQLHVAVRFSVGPAGAGAMSAASHLGQLIIELKAADEREQNGERNSEQILAELRKTSEGLAGVNSVAWLALSGGPAGKDVEVVVNGPNFEEIIDVAQNLKRKLATFDGTVDIDDDFRSAMYGKESRRITRNREDVKIMVRYPEAFRDSVYNLESMWVPVGASAERGWAPLASLARLTEAESYGTLHRSQQMRSVRVLCDVQEGISSDKIRHGLQSYFDDEVRPDHQDVSIEFQGVAEDQAKSFDSLRVAMPLSLLIIYAIVASVFRSYYQPVVVMMAIPFGMMGAIVGHGLTGFPITIISAIGFVALTGIVVNDAIVLIDYVNVRI
ncbi:MAG: hypothetical protein B7Z55_19710 [Planctomycetales bacterium 12-60-4]|nr:MAG: hypothetical protein B7Z55_19710 [Planctomycetales bacterium 12-60-4]